MNRLPKLIYTPGEIGRQRAIEDFLPPPDQLVLREENVKVTLSQRSVASLGEANNRREAF